MAEENKDYALTLFEACEYLNKSARTISRYIRRGILHPQEIKSRQSTLEYRFSKMELENLKKSGRQDILYLDDDSNEDGLSGAKIMNSEEASSNNNITDSQDSSPNIIAGKVSLDSNNAADSINKGEVNRLDRQDKTEITENVAPPAVADNNSGIVILLKETTEMLRDQLKVKDGQIKDLGDKIDQLIERGRETNILLKGMQDKMLLLENPPAQSQRDIGKADEGDFKPQNDFSADAQSGKEVSKNSRKARPQKRELPNAGKSKPNPAKKSFFGRIFG